jgi:hypothetical protein
MDSQIEAGCKTQTSLDDGLSSRLSSIAGDANAQAINFRSSVVVKNEKKK